MLEETRKFRLLMCLLGAAFLCAPAVAQESVRGRVANPHGSLNIRCENCHTSTAWKPIRKQAEFDHDRQTSFPLQGLHQGVACESCHANLVFSAAPTRCSECHADLHRRQFGSDCQSCHTVGGWKVAISALKQHSNRFPLIGAHATATCDDCHHGAAAGVYTGLSTECIACHRQDYQRAAPLNHVTAKLPVTCQNCHSINVWTGASFNHTQLTSFALTGAHASVQCVQCHANGVFAGTSAQCVGCHLADFNRTTNPNHQTGKFSTSCEGCHTTTGWQGAKFDHNLSRFPLTGAHASTPCAQCHVNGVFTGTPAQCVGCHLADFQKTTSPNHATAGLPQECASCHTTTNWTGATFNHGTYGFALAGLHASQQCAACHVNNNFTLTSAACINCHLNDFNGANNPPHKSAGFPEDCTVCHGSSALNWTGATFNHTTTGFALTGAHANQQCAQCHANNNFSLTSGACWSCHQTDYNNTTKPSHKQTSFPQDCSGCHTMVDWTGATFNHATTGFALAGLHASQQCAACHVNNNYTLTGAACIGCHLNDFNGANNPPHKAAGFPQDCALCHGSSALNWTSATFDHATTGFTLTGAHTSQQCSQCHVNNNYSLTTGACWNCHQTDYNNTNNPAHKSANFPQDCSGCHTTTNWSGATFNHATTGFALAGLHATQQCAGCHANNNFSLTSAACINCHQTDYNGANNPPHKAAGFPQDCAVCHGSSALNWTSATFNHATTGFTLTGSHTNAQCALCHVSNNYSLTSGACWGCHQIDYNGTNNPPHKSGNFPQDCSGCHTTTNWNGATFNHASTGFALVGLHGTQQCATCHVNNNFNLSSAACATCHLADFNKTTNPPHKSAGFPMDCTLCHGSTALNWSSAKFNHTTTGFTLTGAHVSLQCAQCHVSDNYSLTSGACWNCHQTDFNKTNNPPHKSANFPQDCSGCHTTTNWNGATFNHATTGFALVGLHATQQCAGCHVNNNFSLTSAACINCHQTDYNGANNPPHKAAGIPLDCTLCHGSSALNWTSATFNHTTTGFALVGLHASQQCAACHVSNNYSLTSGACWGCHQTDFNGALSPPHKQLGYAQDCTLCHGTAVLNWTSATFDHASTGFALTGAHNSQQCAACHVSNNYSLTSGACWNCHQTAYNGTNNPPHKSANFPQDCSGCHTTTNWNGATFNHATTGFALVGLHATQQCAACHVNNNYSLTSGACWSCHQTDYNGALAPPHKQLGYAQDCTLCHGISIVNWGSATFDHASTGFALVGLHATQQCAACHVNNNFSLTSAACWGCHQAAYNGTANPPHKSAGFPQDCTGCHGSTALNWTTATFNHATTGFTLTGTHTNLQCAQCHVNNNYSLTSGACWGCHQTDYNGTNNPPHKSANFPQDCAGCHTTTDWSGATFNHATTGFTLVGLHASQQCAACHVSNNYTLNSTACWNCHQAAYNGANSPPHLASGFPQDCTGCHGSTALNWTSATFDHGSTGFALVGLHATQQCAACHVNNNYSLTSAACWGCHQAAYNGANSPPHLASGFPQDCTGCHGSTAVNWTSATFNHTTTGFALTGAHSSLQCALCHVNNNYGLTSANAACWNCHQSNYNATTNPPHKSSGFPQDCSGCHTTTDWTGAVFNHATTGFALTGTHLTILCAQCHVSNNYSLTSANAACWSCHQTNYNGTTSPAHQAAGFPQDCSLCHSTTNWSGATFSHPTTPLQLTGFHATMLANNQCTQCHVGNNYTSTPSDCYSCHKTDYQNTTNPGHAAAGFPTTCNTCHTFVDWTGAIYTAHDAAYFPIYSGTHQGKWTACGDCHTNSANYAVFTCIVCHQHSNQTSVTSNHSGVKNFVYNGTSCYSCHPRGSAG